MLLRETRKNRTGFGLCPKISYFNKNSVLVNSANTTILGCEKESLKIRKILHKNREILVWINFL
jgi:hypothetical protein